MDSNVLRGWPPDRYVSIVRSMKVSRSRFRLCLFGFAPSREPGFLAPIVRTGFQFVVLTRVAIEMNNFLRFVACFRHGVAPSGTALTAPAFWTHDAEASASSDVSAS